MPMRLGRLRPCNPTGTAIPADIQRLPVTDREIEIEIEKPAAHRGRLFALWASGATPITRDIVRAKDPLSKPRACVEAVDRQQSGPPRRPSSIRACHGRG